MRRPSVRFKTSKSSALVRMGKKAVDISAREKNFSTVSDRLLDSLHEGERLSLRYAGEISQFVRINDGRIRQAGVVDDSTLTLNLFIAERNATTTLPLGGEEDSDFAQAKMRLDQLRQIVPQTLIDPDQQLPTNHGETSETSRARLPDFETAASAIAPPIQGTRFSGFYAGGPIMRGNRNSAGQKHWFCSENFALDYTMLAPAEKSVKRIFAGRDWSDTAFNEEINAAQSQIEALGSEPVTVPVGQHRCYLAPAAVAELVTMLSWNGLSEAAMQQGTSGLLGLKNGKKLSPLFSLKENFERALVPRFNEDGELAAAEISIIRHGQLEQTLINARTASEYSLESNAANCAESLRAPDIAPGDLAADAIIDQLDTGIYISNLHYLNWSDPGQARITGMTRNACFWVENGRLVAPIHDLRFDDSLYNLLGDNLLAVGQQQELIAEVNTYFSRSLGGAVVPGLLIDNVSFTL